VREDAEYVWVLDPIDGTKSFICGLPMWGTLIGLTHLGRPCTGLMHQPFTRERFSGDCESAYWRGPARGAGHAGETDRRRMSVRPCATLKQATLMTTSPTLIAEDSLEAFQRVEREARLSRYGGDCYAYCALASGHVDLVIETNLNPYDIVALIPIVQGAGGVVTTWTGESAEKGGSIIAAGDARAHEAALKLLQI
jgi:myo-inositol-1(or 4)-monophosphatase